MTQQKALFRGTDDFKELINGYFIDKTPLIQEVLDDTHKVILITKPRRFGKSLNLSMLANFFDIQQPTNVELFKPLKIWKMGKKYTDQCGKYPVIHLTLKDVDEDNFEDCLEFLKDVISELFQKYIYLLSSSKLNSIQKKDINNIIERTASKTIFKRSLKKLSQALYDHHGEKVIILIDEYDCPILAGYRNGYYHTIIRFMKSFFGGAFKTNNSLQKGVITGVMRVSKESLFSHINNVEVYSVLDYRYADKFGFTEEETQTLLQYFNMGEDFQTIKKWYDGYNMGNVSDIYNPWSITGYIAKPEQGFKAHWVNTSGDDLIKERIVEQGAEVFRSSVEALLQGQSIEKPVEEQIIFADFLSKKDLFWSLLLYSGYLTPVRAEVSSDFYELKIPSYEIKTLFQKIIRQWFDVGLNVHASLLHEMIKSLTQNRIKDFEKYFKEIMGDTFSYFDLDNPNDEEQKKQAEKVWQAYTLGVLSIASEDYIIKSNRESGNGRYDILLLPKVKTKYGILIEVKTMDKDASEKQIATKLKKALGQIEKNEYYKELIAHDIPKRIEIAMVFAGKKVHIQAKND